MFTQSLPDIEAYMMLDQHKRFNGTGRKPILVKAFHVVMCTMG